MASERGRRAWGGTVAVLAAFVAGCTESLPHGGTFHPAEPEKTERSISMVWPAAGAIASPYRPPSRPDHRGIDLAAPPGSVVVAARAGEVGFVGRIPGYGNVVAIDHGDGLATVYSHLADEIRAAQGTRVAGGEPIGRIGPEGYLHFEIRRNKEPVDPAAYFAAPPPAPAAAAGAAAVELAREPAERVPLEAGSPSAERLQAAARPAPVAVEAASVPPAPSSSAPPPPGPAAAGSGGPPPPVPGSPPQPAIAAAPGSPGPLEAAAAPGPPVAGGSSAGLVAGLAVANFFYVPAKLAYVASGTVVGSLAYALTGGAVPDVLEESYGGDWVVAPRHLRGEAPLRFKGEAAPR